MEKNSDEVDRKSLQASLMSRIDLNQDGKISLEEFTVVYEEVRVKVQQANSLVQKESPVSSGGHSGNFLLIYICYFHVLNHFLLIYICELHWNLLLRPVDIQITLRKMSSLSVDLARSEKRSLVRSRGTKVMERSRSRIWLLIWDQKRLSLGIRKASKSCMAMVPRRLF